MSLNQDNINLGAKRIKEIMGGKGPFLIGRNGTIELQLLYFWSVHRQMGLCGPSYPEGLASILEQNAGVFPATDASIDAWAKAYIEAIETVDGIAAGWYKPVEKIEADILDIFTQDGTFRCPLRSLEPFYVESELQWTRAIPAGSKVCVVSSFAETIHKQVSNLKSVWGKEPNGLFPTDIEWSTVRTGYAPSLSLGTASWPPFIKRWEDAVAYVTREIESINPDIVLIGCGALGMIIGSAAKKLGCKVIVLGGATQVLFGIKGKRWATHNIISTFWNDAWVWPSDSETPKGAFAIEGGCYWG
jgi:hypothetical protein